MDVSLPADLPEPVRSELLAREKAYSQELQRAGVWLHLWRCAGRYANLSVFDVRDNDHLHEVLWGLPLFAHLTISVTPLARHPSAIGSEASVPRPT
ncbi:muconolactone delta-isomerase [Kineococcus sp. R8]|nr:muconolactone Delta-isomerase family protein [Kineococcus siccus]NAZ80410.1 muconolactone delta-isomerase [Kineococcus siccus]